MARDSVMIEVDAVDTAGVEVPWFDLAQQLKQDLASIILMSEADLQVQYHQIIIILPVVVLLKKKKCNE